LLKKLNLKKATKILKNSGEEVLKKNALHVIKDEDNALNLLQATDDFLLEGSLNNWSVNDDYLKVTVNGEVIDQTYDLFNDNEIKEFKDIYNSINSVESTPIDPDMNSVDDIINDIFSNPTATSRFEDLSRPERRRIEREMEKAKKTKQNSSNTNGSNREERRRQRKESNSGNSTKSKSKKKKNKKQQRRKERQRAANETLEKQRIHKENIDRANEWQRQEANRILDENMELVNKKFNSNIDPNQTWTPDERPRYNSTQKEIESYIDVASSKYNPDDYLEALDGSYYAPEGGYFEKQEVEVPIKDTKKTKKISTDAAEEAAEKTIEQVTDDLADTTGQKKVVRNRMHSVKDALDPNKLSKLDMANAAFSVIGAVSTYKSARREGHGVVSSTVRAGLDFAQGELLGFWGNLGVGLVKTIPSVAIAGTEMLYKESRRMNSAANAQVFGGAQFADNQQLATMRQSGMEMAKMANYNLQQTLMGNEATYLHR
jgi:hypothetical protein